MVISLSTYRMVGVGIKAIARKFSIRITLTAFISIPQLVDEGADEYADTR